jgi:cytochrome c5
MPRHVRFLLAGGAIVFVTFGLVAFRQASPTAQTQQTASTSAFDSTINQNAQRMLEEGRKIFRFDTFGSEDFWGGKLRLHEAIVGQKLGGVGPGVSPKMALSLGLKVDAEALPADLVAAIKAGKVDMDDPASTVALLKANAVVGVTAFLNPDGSAKSVGIQCSMCHSTVDDSFAPGIGKRLDGWGNRDLNVGAIVATAPNLQPFSDLLGVTWRRSKPC